MKKVRNIMLIALIALTVVSMYSVAGTYAKYTSEVSGTSTATVAKWAFELNGTTMDLAQNFTFDLFDTIYDEDGNDEDDVASGLIAPGTAGEFKIALTNKSEVNAEYTIEFTNVDLKDVPIEFTTDKANTGSWTTDITDLNVSSTAIDMNCSATPLTIYWRWAYSAGNDSGDTNLGITAATGEVKPEVTAKITVTQVD